MRGEGARDAPGFDPVKGAVDHQVGLVLVEVELPQVREPEGAVGAVHAVDGEAGVHHFWWLVETDGHVVHPGNQPRFGEIVQ
jgi:hypothetical protein